MGPNAPPTTTPQLQDEKEWQLLVMLLCKPGNVKTAPLFALRIAARHSAVADSLHSTLNIIAVWILQCVGAMTLEKQKPWANTAAFGSS